MTAKKKKPFWVKLLSALLVASMLMGSAGISSFAASDSPDEKPGVEELVSNESAGDEKNTAETPETSAANEAAQDLEDTGKTGAGEDTKTEEDADVSDTEGNLQSKEEAGTSDVEDNQQSKEEAGASDAGKNQQSKEEAGTSDAEDSLKDKAEGDVSSETGDENVPSDVTDTGDGGVIPGTADAESGITDSDVSSGGAENAGQVAEDIAEVSAETEPVNEEVPAEVQAFLDAVADIPEITLENAVEVAEYIYGPVSEAYDALLGTEFMERDDVKAAEEIYGQAIADVEAALELKAATFDNIPVGVGTTDPNVLETAFITYEKWDAAGNISALRVSGNYALYDCYGEIVVNPDGQSETVDSGNMTFYTNYGTAVSTSWSENGGLPSVWDKPDWLDVSLRGDGGVLYVTFKANEKAKTGNKATIKLSYAASWKVVTNNGFFGEGNGKAIGDIYYSVTAEEPSEPGAPRKPNANEINYWSNDQELGIQAKCSTNTSVHRKAFWPVTVATYPDSYSLGPVVKNTGSNASQYPWTCTLTVNNDWWAKRFSTYNAANWPYRYGPHWVDTEKTGTLTSTFYWTGAKWVNLDKKGEVLTVWLTCKPPKPSKPSDDELSDLTVKVSCVNKDGSTNSKCYNMTRNLTAYKKNYTVSDVVANPGTKYSSSDFPYMCTITLDNEAWLETFASVLEESKGITTPHLVHSKTGTVTKECYYSKESSEWLYELPQQMNVYVWEKPDDLKVTKVRTSGDTAKVKDKITWDITITNKSETVDKTVTVEDILGGATGSVVVKNGAAVIGKTDKVTVPAGGSVVLKATYEVRPEDVGKTITNKVKVTDEADKDLPKEADDGSGVTVGGTPELTVTKEVDKASVKVGIPLTYTITVKNDGDGDAENVEVSDTLPAELADSIQSSTPVSYTRSMAEGKATFTWNLGTIDAGEYKTVEFTVKTEKAGRIENGASVKSYEITTPVETEEPAKTTIYDLEVTKKNDGFKVNEETGIAAVHYTVTVENKSGFALYGLDIIDTLKTEVKDTKNDPINTVKMTLKPVSLKLDGKDIGTPGDESEPEANKEGQVRTWNVLPRSEEFKDGSTVTLVYDIEIENTGDTGVQVNLDNRAKGGSWTTGENSLSPVREILRRAFVGAGRSSDPYDAEDEDGSSASGGTSSTGGFIPVKKTFELVYDLKGGSNGPANQTVTTTQENVTSHEFDVAGRETSAVVPTNGEKVFKGWAETEDGDIVYAFDSETKSYNPEKVTVALESGKTASKTLYAVWAEPARKITVKYWAEGADPDSDEPLTTEIITVIDGKRIVDGDKYKETELVTVEDIDKDGNHYIVETIPSSDEKTVSGDVVIDVICTLDNKTDEENDGNGDKPGDGIPDKYQKEVKFVAVNGSFDPDDETVTEKTVVVTLFDSDNKPSENGIGHLTEKQIPEAAPNTDYEGNGTWNPEIPTVEYEITEDKTFTIVFTNGNALTVGAGDVTVTYDGAQHPVVPGVNDPDADVKVEYRRTDENGTPVGDPLDDAPKDAGTYIASITATLPDGTAASSEAKVVINKRGLTVTTGSGSKNFDNTPLTNSTAAVTVQGGNVAGEIITATATGSQTAIGSSTNGYEIDWNALGINPDNYEITAVLGTLTVNAAAPTTPPGGGDGNESDPTPTPPGGGTGGGGGTNPESTPAAPESTTTTPQPTPIVPEPVPAVGPVQTVPAVTPVAPTSTVPTPTAALASPTPEMAELSDEDVPLAGEGEEEEPETVIKPAELKDEAVPMAAGKGLSWALINFALMNLAVFESLMLLIGYFIKTKGSSEEDEEEKKKLKKKGIMRIISLPVAVISVIAFILTEDITLPTAFVDRYTILMAVIAIVQTAVVALSRKEVKDEEEQKAEA